MDDSREFIFSLSKISENYLCNVYVKENGTIKRPRENFPNRGFFMINKKDINWDNPYIDIDIGDEVKNKILKKIFMDMFISPQDSISYYSNSPLLLEISSSSLDSGSFFTSTST